MYFVLRITRTRKRLALLIMLAVMLSLGLTYLRLRFPLKYVGVITEYSALNGIDPAFICAVINAESRFDKNAVSPKNACGLMQLTSMTADWMAEEMPLSGYSFDQVFDPQINVAIGTYYIKMLAQRYNWRPVEILAAYNAGSGNVAKWLANPDYSSDGVTLNSIPFKETRNYIDRVKKGYKIYSIYFKYFYRG